MTRIKKKVFIIIIYYNSKNYIFSCLDSLVKSDINNSLINKKIVVVDNASIDGSIQKLEQRYPYIKIIKNKKNIGFAAGNNLAIKYALKNNADYIILLNPDTIIGKDFILPLIKTVDANQKIGIVAPVLKGEYKGKVKYALGQKFNSILGRTEHCQVKFRPLTASEQAMVSGCSMLIKAEVFKQIGFFDERFFLYFEDSDFCLRARNNNFKIYITPESTVYHNKDTSFNSMTFKKIFYLLKGNRLFIGKNVKIYFRPIAYGYLILITIKIIINKILSLLRFNKT